MNLLKENNAIILVPLNIMHSLLACTILLALYTDIKINDGEKAWVQC